jgi:hypothetical protein
MTIEGIDKCVLFFDTYELLWNEGRGEENKLRNDAWIRTMAGMDMLDNVIFVLSGREKLQWELESKTWLDKVKLVQLDVLAPDFAKRWDCFRLRVNDLSGQKSVNTKDGCYLTAG